MSLLSELKRRNVFRAAAAYVAVAWLVMQVAEVSFPAFGFSDRALRLLIIALAIGFVPAVALAWVFELTPEGVRRDRDLEPGGPLLRRTNRLLDRAIVVLLALGLTYFAIDKFFLNPSREAARVEQALEQGRSEALEQQLAETSIVVLPFTNLSSDPEQAFFADGMAEELLNLLARIPQLRVISRTSAFSYKGKDVGIAEIARQLKVSHVLEGSVRRSGDRLRITAQLIDAGSDSHLWSRTYDRTLDDVFEVQDEIAFVGMRPFYGLNLYLDVHVESVEFGEKKYEYSKYVSQDDLCDEIRSGERNVYALKQSRTDKFLAGAARCADVRAEEIGTFEADGNRIAVFRIVAAPPGPGTAG